MRNWKLFDAIESEMEWKKWREEIPYISFPSNWKIQVSPPYAGAVVRFRVKKGDKDISVYLDCYNNLGYWDGPYWEIYPYRDDTGRCDMHDTDKLLEMIGEELLLTLELPKLLESPKQLKIEKEGWQKEIEPRARKIAAKLGMEVVMFGPKEKGDE